MVFDSIKNYRQYTGLGTDFAKVFECISGDQIKKEPGRYELSGGIYYLVQSYETKPESEGFFEAHRKYIDVQYIAAGRELHNFTNLAGLKTREPYSEEKDVIILDGKGNGLVLETGFFAVYFPEDAHMPNLRAGVNPEKVIKVVFKIPVNV